MRPKTGKKPEMDRGWPCSLARLARWTALVLGFVALTSPGVEVRGQSERPLPPLGSRQHDYASLRNADFELNDFEVKRLTGEKVRLGELIRGRKIVLLHFFATFCHNSNYDVATIRELYEKYHDAGFEVIGLGDYSTVEELERFVARHRLTYPMVMEEEQGRKKTRHYRYRTLTGDDRKWGTPFSIVIDGGQIDPAGEKLARRMYVARGELIRAEIESLIRRSLAAGN